MLIASYLSGQEKENRQLERSLDELIGGEYRSNEPGIAVLVAKGDNVIYKKAFGSANIELQVTLTPDMVFRIGSITKQFTAIGVLQLIEKGKLSLKDSVQHWIQDFPSKGAVITVENLLTHTSGLIDYASMNDPDPYIERRDFTLPFIIDYFKNEPLQFKPGTAYGYSNSNYALLAYIIEKVTGKDYHTYMKENVLQPAGLTHTYYAAESEVVPNRVAGYTRDKGFYENCYYQTISLGYGCGDLMSTVSDLYKWNKALLSYKLVGKATLDKAFTPYTLSDGTSTTYGYGWFIDEKSGMKCIHHEGQVSGFIALEKYFPGENIYLAILTNIKSGEDKTEFSNNRFELFNKIAARTIDIAGRKISMSNEVLESYAGTYQAGRQTIEVKRKNGGLSCFASMEGNFDLVAVSKNKFIIKNSNPICSFEFTRDSLNNVTEFISLQKARFDWMRVNSKDNEPDPSGYEFTAYTGEYQLPSMRNTFITVTIENNRLMATSTTPLPAAGLIRIAGDRFKYDLPGYDMVFEFIKDEKGLIQKVVIEQGAIHCKKIK